MIEPPDSRDPSGAVPPDFSPFAEAYARSRPAYPPELFAFLAGLVDRQGLAWDCATGNGQAAAGLAAHFEHVVATDQSREQLRFAIRHDRVEYRSAPAEASGIPDSAVDLTTVAAAVHWFDLERFYREVRRVTRDGGVLAVWSYHASHVNAPFDRILDPFYREVVAPYFAPGARLVDRRYEDLRLPGTPVEGPVFHMTARWTAAEIIDYVRNWSGTHAYVKEHGTDPVADIEDAITQACGDRVCTLRWPLYLRVSRL